MFSGTGLVVSLPGAAIADLDLPGSVVPPQAIPLAALSPDLRAALLLVRDEAARRGVDIKYVARPELFINRRAEGWLGERIGAVSQHLCLSDGTSLKILPGLHTHVFFYRRSCRDDLMALELLSRRAPECLARVRGQVNSHFVLGDGPTRVRPAPLFLGATTPLDHPRSILLPFFLNRHSAEDTAHHIARQGPAAPESLGDFAAMCYIPLTDTAMGDRDFARAVASMVLRACLDPAVLLILRLPSDRDDSPDLAGRIASLLPALRDCGLVLPRASPRNIFFATCDLEENHPLIERVPLHVVVPESFDYWRHTAAFYARAEQVTVLTGGQPFANQGFLPYDVSGIYGPRAVRRGIG